MLSQGHAPKIETKNKPGVTALREIAAGEVGIEMLRKVPCLTSNATACADTQRHPSSRCSAGLGWPARSGNEPSAITCRPTGREVISLINSGAWAPASPDAIL